MLASMYHSTESGQFIDVHPRLAELLGYANAEDLKQAVNDIGTQLYANPGHRLDLLADLRNHGEVHRREIELLHRDGSSLPVAVYARRRQQGDAQQTIEGAVVDLRPLRIVRPEDNYRDFFENSTIGMYRSTLDGHFLDVNEALAKLLGYGSVTELLTCVVDISELYCNSSERPDTLSKISAGEALEPVEFQLRHRDGHAIWIREFGRSVRDGRNQVVYFEGTLQDITEEKTAQAALRKSEARYRALVDNCRVGVFVNQEGIYTYVNTALEEMLGYSPGSLHGKHFRNLYAPEALSEAEARYRARQRGEESASVFETTLLHANGEDRISVIITISALEQDGIVVSTGTVTDISAFKRIERQLRHNATHDPLTDLPNRTLFLQRLARTMTSSETSSQHYAVLFVDLDGFKVINDSLGHAAGDVVLVEIARRIQRCLNPWDMVSRHGGDEFTILLENVASPSSAVEIVRRLRESLNEPLALLDTELFTNASIGIVIGNSEYPDADAILRDADTAMYSAKAGGQNGIALFDQRMHETARLRLQLETDLRLGMERNEFRLYYQPICDLKTERIRGFEALLRWQHPTLGLLSPNEFLAVAEETGQIIPLGWWILETALEQLTRWQLDTHRNDLYMSMNLAHRQFHHPQLIERLRRALRGASIQPGTLHIELTETIFMDNPDAAIERLHALKEVGVELFLDDFGTGYSSFAHLNRYAIDKLKIDRSFIMDDSRRARRILRSIVQLAKALDIGVIGEGIEEVSQLKYLRRLGITQGQGYLLGNPMPADAAGRELVRPRRTRLLLPSLRK